MILIFNLILLVTMHQRGNAPPDAPASTDLVLRRTQVRPDEVTTLVRSNQIII